MIEIKSGEVYWVKGNGPMLAVSEVNTHGIVDMRTPTGYGHSVRADDILEASNMDLESYGRQHKCLFPLDETTCKWINQQLSRRTDQAKNQSNSQSEN
jgi:uncharacterized protein YodC (DUF2158 family)